MNGRWSVEDVLIRDKVRWGEHGGRGYGTVLSLDDYGRRDYCKRIVG